MFVTSVRHGLFASTNQFLPSFLLFRNGLTAKGAKNAVKSRIEASDEKFIFDQNAASPGITAVRCTLLKDPKNDSQG